MIRFIFLFLFIAFVSFEVQGQEANIFLSKLVAKLESVDDYSADVLIKADIPLIKILPSKAKIYFKKPDKFKVVSKGIAILPRQGFTDMNLFLSIFHCAWSTGRWSLAHASRLCILSSFSLLYFLGY